mgnify:CR=1 FL=1
MKKSLLFTLVMALLCLFGNVKAQTTPEAIAPGNDGVLPFSFPNSTTVLVWTGEGADNNWTTAANWMDGTKYKLKNWNNHTIANCDVFIPENVDGKYPVLTSDQTCNRIYLASGAMLGNQFYLSATYGWYTDIVIPTNCWVLLSSPLTNTYTGDFFTAIQGGKYYGPWDGSLYDGVNGNSGPNRNFPSGIYQRLFSSYITIDHLGLYFCRYYESAWSSPTNVMTKNYQVAEGFQVLARDMNNTQFADFHFPSAEDTYYFYSTSGNKLTNNPQAVSHTESNRPAYNASVIRPMITRETPNDATVPPMFAVGNPAFAKLNIAEFLKENATGGNITPFLYKHNEGNINNIVGSETIYYLDLNNNTLYTVNATASDTEIPSVNNTTPANGAVIERNRGFRVMAGKAEVKCIEPDLLGVYQIDQIAPAHPQYKDGDSNIQTNESLGAAASQMTIATGETPDEVLISNFAGWGVVKGIINTANHTITIAGGQEASMISGRGQKYSSGWSCSNRLALYTMGSNDQEIEFGELTNIETDFPGNNFSTKTIQSQVANNVSESNAITIQYTIDPITQEVSFQTINAFAIYPRDRHYTLQSNIYTVIVVSWNNLIYATPWICFNRYAGKKVFTANSTSSQYINTNFFGTFRYQINDRNSWNVASNNSYHQFTISPIAGKFDVVEIKGFYPNNTTTIINGKIEANNGTYSLIIPKGQRVYESGNITNDYFIYDESQDDVIINLNSNGDFSFAKRVMVTRLNSVSKSWGLFDWTTVSGFKTSTALTKTADWSGVVTDPTQIQIGSNKNSISLYFNENMFTVGNNTSAHAPRRTAAQGSNAASIKASYNDNDINTILLRNQTAYNGYNPAEDAALVDIDDEAFSISTVAGSFRCVVNAINDTTRCQIVLTGVNGDVDLVFDNLAALGENVRLFDANDSTFTALNGNHATVTVNFGVNDSPLRYSLVWDYTPIIAGNETLTAIDFTAFSPAKGEVKVMSNELLKGVRVYNAAGQLITSTNANANEVSFSNLLSGIYVIEAYTTNGKATKKVDVK